MKSVYSRIFFPKPARAENFEFYNRFQALQRFFLWIMTIKTPLKTNDFENFSLKNSSEQKLYRFEN
jgi:hypothetical protein